MTKCRVEQDELDYDTQQGQWKPSIFDHFEETFQKLGDDKPATNVTGGSFAVVENDNAS